MEEKVVKDFEENLKILNLVNNSLENDKKKLIFLVKVKENKTAVFKIYEKDRIWLKFIDFKAFVEYRNSLGFDGNWQTFFFTLKLAILREKGGDMQLKYPKTNKALFFFIQDSFFLYFYHPISEDLKVKGEISLEKQITYQSEEFRSHLYELVFDLHESEEMHKNNLNSDRIEHNTIQTNIDSKKKTKITEMKKATKRKFVSDLVNPNAKRRKNKGVKFVNDGEDKSSNTDKLSKCSENSKNEDDK